MIRSDLSFRALGLALALCFAFPAVTHANLSKTREAQLAGGRVLQRNSLRFPILLVHGATEHGSTLKVGPFDFGDYFENIVPFYANTGTPVKTVELTSDGSIAERAMVLKSFIETQFPNQGVNIVAHSLGGLDARYAATILGCNQISTITTIGTPHHGTPLADWASRQMHHRYPWYWFFRLLGYDMRQRRFLDELTTSAMKDTFNPRVPDMPDVHYYSVTSEASFETSTMSYLLWLPEHWLTSEENPMNEGGDDGLVPKSSMAWGKVIGNFQIDHLGQINHHEFRPVDLTDTSFSIYTTIYDNLLKEGF